MRWKLIIIVLLILLIGSLTVAYVTYKGQSRLLTELAMRCDGEFGVGNWGVYTCELGFCCAVKPSELMVDFDNDDVLSRPRFNQSVN